MNEPTIKAPHQRPPWAADFGADTISPFPWAEVDCGKGVKLRLRWIPPGTFLMGSPPDEPGRYHDEGPAHRVTITRGFWLAETPCTQALWKAVTGENPSRFRSPDRPVENVSWEDAQEFCARIKDPGLALRLPTEAEWEYACRAGTTTALYSGPMEILGENNAPALDPIAWYGGNSGKDFDVENGWESSSSSEKQYEHTRAGTHPVKGKEPNPWGLYDMLGNVWEWCADGKRRYTGDPAVDPEGPAGSSRVLRGGSWINVAPHVRCAIRYAYVLCDRPEFCGFRVCAP